MASGRLSAVDLLAGVNTLLYTMPGGRAMNVSVRIVNRNTEDVTIRLALLDGDLSTLADEDYIEYNTILRANGYIEHEVISMSQLQTLVGYSDTSNVTFQIGGSNLL